MKESKDALLDLSKAHWHVDFANNQVIRSANHDSFFGHLKNLPEWSIEVFFRHIHPLDSEKFSQAIKNTMADAKSFDHTYRVVWPDESIHHLRSWGFIECDSHTGKPTRLIGYTEFAPPAKVATHHKADLF